MPLMLIIFTFSNPVEGIFDASRVAEIRYRTCELAKIALHLLLLW